MRAAVVTRFGGPDVIETREVPDPEPAAGQVLVGVAIADVIFVETAIRRGAYGEFFDVRTPYVPGTNLGGKVRAVGPGVDADWIGKTVVGRGVAFGAHAELALTATDLVEVPPELDLPTAVAVYGDGFTALMLEELAPPMAGQDVLITASAGGMGLLLIQLAHQAGARVVAAARGDEKLELSRAQGADVLLDYSRPGWEKSVLEATNGPHTFDEIKAYFNSSPGADRIHDHGPHGGVHRRGTLPVCSSFHPDGHPARNPADDQHI